MYSCNCDNCGETYRDDHSGFTAYPDESNLLEAMDNDDWYTGHTDEDHQDNQYCPNCFKQHETIDDKIIVDTTRKVETKQPESPADSIPDQDADKDRFAIAFSCWAMFDPQAKAYRDAGISAAGLLDKYKSRPYIDNDTSKQ